MCNADNLGKPGTYRVADFLRGWEDWRMVWGPKYVIWRRIRHIELVAWYYSWSTGILAPWKMHIKMDWESGEKGFSTGLMSSLLCDFVWVTPPFFYMCYLLLYTMRSLQQKPCVGSRKGLKHHLPETNPWQHPALTGANTGPVSETGMDSPWWYCCASALLSEPTHLELFLVC